AHREQVDAREGVDRLLAPAVEDGQLAELRQLHFIVRLRGGAHGGDEPQDAERGGEGWRPYRCLAHSPALRPRKLTSFSQKCMSMRNVTLAHDEYGNCHAGLRTTCNTVPFSVFLFQSAWKKVSPRWRSGSFMRIVTSRSSPRSGSSNLTLLEKFFGVSV